MSFPVPLMQHRRSRRFALLAASALATVTTPAGAPPALAQQSVSPNLELPTVVVRPPSAPRRRPRARPARRVATPPPAQPSTPAEPSPAAEPPSAPSTPLVVSPTAVPTPQAQVASSVTVMTAQEIEQRQERTAPDLLRTVPGLNVIQAGGPGGLTSVFTRGTNPNHTKIFIDGIDVSDPSNVNRVFDLGQLLTGDIERIEVLRGPQSGLYGADALGGVISIITKKGSGPPRATASLEAGSFGTFNQTLGLSGGAERINYAFNVLHFRSTDTPVTPLDLLPPGRRRINDFYDNWTLSTKLGAQVAENLEVNVVARYTDSLKRFTQDDFSVFPPVPAATQSTQHLKQFFTRGEAAWSVFGGALVNRFSAAYTDHWSWNKGPDTIFGPALPSINTGDRTKVEYRGDLTISPGNLVLFGLQAEIETLRTATTRAENGNRAGYLELQTNPLPNLFVVANLRHDDNDRFGGATTYRVAPAYIIPMTATKLKGSYGTAFKAPTLAQMFVDFPPFFFGNPNLRPEQATGYDAGFEQPLWNDRVRFGATYFHNDISNLITANATFTSYANIGAAETEGVETFLQVGVTDRIKLRGDYTFTRAVDAATGLELLRRPRHKASATVTWNPIDPLLLSATVLHVGDWIDGNRTFTIQRLVAPGYTIVNLAANYRVNEHLKMFARVENLFDLKYQNPSGFERPGFGIFGGIRVASRDVN